MTTPTPESVPPRTGDGIDGRSRRWEAHRAARRAELVAATLRAIRRSGAGVGMDEIAGVAGTSKTVFYRHFGDRAGLYRGVAESVDAMIAQRMNEAIGPDAVASDAQALLRAAVDTYLRLVEDDPEVYRFIVAAPLLPATERALADPVTDVTDGMSGRMAALLSTHLVAAGREPEQARTWGLAVVGLVRSVADQWLRSGASSSGTGRERLVDDVTALLWGGLGSAWDR